MKIFRLLEMFIQVLHFQGYAHPPQNPKTPGGMFKIKIIQKFPERSALMNYSVTRIKDTQIPEPTAPTPSFHVGSSTWYHFFLMFFISSKSD